MRFPCRPFISLCLGLSLTACAFVSSIGSACGAPLSPALSEFKTAWQRVQNRQPDQPDPVALRALPIYAYLDAARLQRDLQQDQSDAQFQQTDAAVRSFLDARTGEPVTRSLTTAWMRSLAKRQDWSTLLENYNPARADAKLRCRWYQARIATHRTKGLVRKITHTYRNTGHSLMACKPAFDWLKAQHKLPPALTVARAKLALKQGHADFASQLAAQLPKTAAAPILQWVALIEHPQRSIRELIAHPSHPVPKKALQDGWLRLARKHPDIALQLYPELLQARHLSGLEARPYTRALALGLVWDRRPQAVTYFRRFTPKRGDDTAYAWRVRAALWAEDWPQALQWLREMPAALRSQPAWQYWLARAEAATGATQAADARWRKLVDTDGYYALLAAWRLRKNYAPQPESVPDDPALRKRLAAMPGMVRAHELFQVGLNPQASLEWWVALAKVDQAARIQGIRLARHWGWYVQAAGTASRQGIYDAFKLLYPRPYQSQVKAAAADSKLPVDWIYGVMRQESLYRANVVSPSGAYGLMQLIMPTARRVAQRNNMPLPAVADDLFDPSTNITLGSDLLRRLTDRYDGRFIVALAGYNAGHNAADRWLPASPRSADVWIENIPYNETRHYIKRILWHIAVFGWLRSGEPQTIARLLPLVAQPDSTAAVAADPQRGS